MRKMMNKLEDWLDDFMLFWDTLCCWEGWSAVLAVIFALVFVGAIVFFGLYASGAFYDEVENYDFTAQVYDKDHYTTQSVSYITSGKSRVPVYHTHHHYKIMWEDGGERGVFEIGEDHYNLIKIGDFVNVHCSVRADKQGELHYYYSFKGY